MLHLLKLEWKKIYNYRPFQVMMLLFMIGLPSMLMVSHDIVEKANPPEGMFSAATLVSFPTIWQYLAYNANWMAFFFLGFMSVLSITNEFGNKTLRQNIITGLSRADYFKGKVLFIATLALIATIHYFLCGTVIGRIYTESFSMENFTENLDFIPRVFLMSFGYMSIGLFLGMWIRRTGIAIVLFLAYGIFIEQILRWGVHMNVFKRFGIEMNKSVHYYPINAMEDLAPIPFPDMIDNMARNMDFYPFIEPMEAAVLTVIYSGLFLYLAYRMISNRDL